MMIPLLLAALLAAPRPPRARPAAPSAPAQQQQQLSADEVHAKVQAYLGGIDTPITAEQWRALGPQAAPELEALINDSSAMPSRRAKAVEGLAAVAPGRAAQLVGPLARDEAQPVVVRVAAMRGAGQVLSPSRALRELKPVLRSARQAGLRGAAADVLSRHQGACAAVKEQAGREPPAQRGAFDRALERCR